MTHKPNPAPVEILALKQRDGRNRFLLWALMHEGRPYVLDGAMPQLPRVNDPTLVSLGPIERALVGLYCAQHLKRVVRGDGCMLFSDLESSVEQTYPEELFI